MAALVKSYKINTSDGNLWGRETPGGRLKVPAVNSDVLDVIEEVSKDNVVWVYAQIRGTNHKFYFYKKYLKIHETITVIEPDDDDLDSMEEAQLKAEIVRLQKALEEVEEKNEAFCEEIREILK